MTANTLLSIVIPTYNRADYLDYSLEIHVPLARIYQIGIFISDNASTDNTSEIVEKWKAIYPLIQYYKNEENLGPDKNFELALKYPKTEYVWLLGDTYRITEKGIDYLLNLIKENNNKYDGIICNLGMKIDELPTQDFTDANQLLSTLGSLMTCLSCLIYSKELINNANFKRYTNTNYMQTGIIFEYIADKKFNIHWANKISIMSLTNSSTLNKIEWWMTDKVFEIACYNWINFIFSLPSSYKIENKYKCIRDFTKMSDVFSLRHLLKIRIKNILNIKTYIEYSQLFPLTIRYPRFIIFIIAIFPKSILKILKVITNISRRLWA